MYQSKLFTKQPQVTNEHLFLTSDSRGNVFADRLAARVEITTGLQRADWQGTGAVRLEELMGLGKSKAQNDCLSESGVKKGIG